jgi:quercetin dioxygenase-like cupin family protein
VTVARGGEVIQVADLTIGFLCEGDEGAPTVFEFTVPPGAKVPAAHRHDGYVETIYGLEGTLTMTVEGEESRLGPGDLLRIARGAGHRFDNHGEATAKALAVVTPGLLRADYFRELAAVVDGATGPPDPAAIGEVMRRHGLTPA